MDEQSYIEGSRRAWLFMLRECLRQLGVDDVEAGKAQWVSERQEAIARLRHVCASFGDNNWPDDLHLADIIEKHLRRHLEA
jgi:hypothetical protein